MISEIFEALSDPLAGSYLTGFIIFSGGLLSGSVIGAGIGVLLILGALVGAGVVMYAE